MHEAMIEAYVEEFCGAMEFSVLAVPEYADKGFLPAKNRETVNKYKEHYYEDFYIQMRMILSEFSKVFLERSKLPSLGKQHRSLVIAHFFKTEFDLLEISKGFSLDITVGALMLGGERVHTVSPNELHEAVSSDSGIDPLQNYHSWLTLDGITVVDPSLLALEDLRSNMKLKKKNAEVIWPSKYLASITYKPMLVDNWFATRHTKADSVVANPL